jgi:hypothetical protein
MYEKERVDFFPLRPTFILMKSNFTTLLVDDNEDDVTLFKRAMSINGIKNPVQIARDGEEAIACNANRPSTRLIIFIQK